MQLIDFAYSQMGDSDHEQCYTAVTFSRGIMNNLHCTQARPTMLLASV